MSTRRDPRDKVWHCSCGRRTVGNTGHAADCTAPGSGRRWQCRMTVPHFGHGTGPRSCPGIDFPEQRDQES